MIISKDEPLKYSNALHLNCIESCLRIFNSANYIEGETIYEICEKSERWDSMNAHSKSQTIIRMMTKHKQTIH